MQLMIQFNNNAALVDTEAKTLVIGNFSDFYMTKAGYDTISNESIVTTYDKKSYNKAVNFFKASGYSKEDISPLRRRGVLNEDNDVDPEEFDPWLKNGENSIGNLLGPWLPKNSKGELNKQSKKIIKALAEKYAETAVKKEPKIRMWETGFGACKGDRILGEALASLLGIE